jgi:hypothetical protein
MRNKKYLEAKKSYEFFKTINLHEDFLDLIKNSESEEEKIFYDIITDYFLQLKQNELLKQDSFDI